MSAIEEAREFLRPIPGTSSTLHINGPHAQRMIDEHDLLARDTELLRRLIRESCVVWEGRQEDLGPVEDGGGSRWVRTHKAGEDGYARLVLDDQFILTDPAEISILKSILDKDA